MSAAFFANLANLVPCLEGMEACAGTHSTSLLPRLSTAGEHFN
jgi:hypothetical protein